MNLKERSRYFRPETFTEHEYEIINDISYYRKDEDKYRKYV